MALAMPKSISFRVPPTNRKLAGFRSEWMIPVRYSMLGKLGLMHVRKVSPQITHCSHLRKSLIENASKPKSSLGQKYCPR
ncbi:hypothetical protein DPMN_043894 [Dreissena polymorpha]|uniref:Uncharacterized protein n=1 Tax=Dreissena polymorpha TaxID=45954 RepID=A0A9D4D1B7_DREPO|nr:hypothetical protein DPMN_043894 [Dreissena polymorpha]